MKAFELKIITPDGLFYSGEAEYLSVQASDGRMGFMRGALPRIESLCAGRVEYKTSVISRAVTCGNGLIRVKKDGVTLITEYARETEEGAARSEPKEDAREVKAAEIKIRSHIRDINRSAD